jgi:hypothetical protein
MIRYPNQPMITNFMPQVLALSLDMKCQKDVHEYVNGSCYMHEMIEECNGRNLWAIVCGESEITSLDLLSNM